MKNYSKKSTGSDLLPVLSLFTGAGGLDLGLEAAGFTTDLCVEVDPVCRRTLAINRPQWMLSERGNIHEFDASAAMKAMKLSRGELPLLAGGPPCQPFSKASYWARGEAPRLRDPRADTLRAYLAYIQCFLPEVLLLENVKGLVYSGKDEGLRLLAQGIEDINHSEGTNYRLRVVHINAAHYGVPQLRERVFLLAHRGGVDFVEPEQTHFPPHSDSVGRPFTTAWDAIGDLDSHPVPDALLPAGKWADLLPSVPEGENYLWHTPRGGGMPIFGWRTRYWSFLLKLAKGKPAWTIPAQPGPATGPFHWRNRRLSVRELCRLQTFPDDYDIEGTYRDAQRQLGNAVPPAIGELLGVEIRRQLLGHKIGGDGLSLIPEGDNTGCPSPEEVHSVPEKYMPLIGSHEDHPGPGLGPGARRRVAVSAE
ncbi:MAG: DNA cytosine methyltransferase [Ectothiorhodospiraceae bacterium]|nr:DNA cytosine methyltransferase [Ectothiorhodospiraceae bacterium]